MRDVFVWGIGMAVAPNSLSCHSCPMGQVSWHYIMGGGRWIEECKSVLKKGHSKTSRRILESVGAALSV